MTEFYLFALICFLLYVWLLTASIPLLSRLNVLLNVLRQILHGSLVESLFTTDNQTHPGSNF